MCDDYTKGVMFKGRFCVLGGGAVPKRFGFVLQRNNPKSQQNTEGR